MNQSYRDVYRSHRVLFTLPAVLAAAIALWAGTSAPKLYESQASLWSDVPGSTTTAFGALPPAGQDQQLLTELLTTRYFQQAVADHSPLRAYLRAHPSTGWGPSALLARLRSPKTLDDRVADALGGKRMLSDAKGPHVLDLGFEAETPALAVHTLRAIIAEFEKQRGTLQESGLQAAQRQVVAASEALQSARLTLTRYISSHPGVNHTDQQLQQLLVAQRQAVTAMSNATTNMNQASLAVADGSSNQTTLRLVDPPTLPTGPVSGKKKLIEVGIAGFFAGGIVSALGVIAVARRRRLVELEDDADEPERLPHPEGPARVREPALGPAAD